VLILVIKYVKPNTSKCVDKLNSNVLILVGLNGIVLIIVNVVNNDSK